MNLSDDDRITAYFKAPAQGQAEVVIIIARKPRVLNTLGDICGQPAATAKQARAKLASY